MSISKKQLNPNVIQFKYTFSGHTEQSSGGSGRSGGFGAGLQAVIK